MSTIGQVNLIDFKHKLSSKGFTLLGHPSQAESAYPVVKALCQGAVQSPPPGYKFPPEYKPAEYVAALLSAV